MLSDTAILLIGVLATALCLFFVAFTWHELHEKGRSKPPDHL